MMRWVWPLGPLSALIVAVATIGSVFPSSIQANVTTGLVQLGIVVGFYAFVGITGVFSFGHVAFAAVGAYTAGILSVPLLRKEVLFPDLPGLLANVQLSSPLAILVGAVIAAGFGFAIALSLGRLSGLSAALATFALLVIINQIARNFEPLTRGTKGMLGVPTTTTIWVAAAWSLAILVVVAIFQESRYGLQLRASREEPIAAEALGIRVGRMRGVAMLLSAFTVGLAGGSYAHLLGSFGPPTFYLDLTFLTIAMLVIGGLQSLTGSVIGPIAVTLVLQLLRSLEGLVQRPGLTEVAFAVILIAVMVLRPSGITGGREFPRPRFREPGGPVAEGASREPDSAAMGG